MANEWVPDPPTRCSRFALRQPAARQTTCVAAQIATHAVVHLCDYHHGGADRRGGFVSADKPSRLALFRLPARQPHHAKDASHTGSAGSHLISGVQYRTS